MHLVNRYADQDRFLPIFAVANSLTEYLANEFAVSVEDLPAHDEVFEEQDRMAYGGLNRVVRVTPHEHDQAPLTIGFHNEPGRLSLTAGSFSTFDLWFCGCDLCDDRWEDTADSLETVVLAVARGGLTERIGRGPWGYARYSLDVNETPPWVGMIAKRSFPAAALREYRRLLENLPRGVWSEYSRR